LTGELDAVARELYLSTFRASGMDFGKAYATAVANYDKALAQAAQNVAGMASARNEVAQNASRDGWMMAGAWYMKFAMLQEQAYNSVNQFPEVSPRIWGMCRPLKRMRSKAIKIVCALRWVV